MTAVPRPPLRPLSSPPCILGLFPAMAMGRSFQSAGFSKALIQPCM
jgi:hypothetical protein